MNPYEASTSRAAYAVSEVQSDAVRGAFTWMALGLVVTGLVGSYVANTPALIESVLRPGLLLVFFLAELGLVFWLSRSVMTMSSSTATGVFLGYSALNGITLAPIAIVYTGQSISSAFLIAASLFGVMALYGAATKRDLSGMGSFLMMGLVGLLIAMLVNVFFQSSGVNFAIDVIGILVFTGLTAWDVQVIKRMANDMQFNFGGDQATLVRRVSILGALRLYLDLINLFLYVLRFAGDRK